MSGEYILEISHLTKSFPKVVALDDVSLQVRPGAIHAVLGEVGAGKTTLMRILGGFYPAGSYEGQILLDGRPLTPRSPGDALRAGVSMVPRRLGLFEHLSIAENIVVGSWQSSHKLLISRGSTEREAREVLARWEIHLDLDQRVSQLTAAQKRLVMIARALCVGPRVIILDEPLYNITIPHAIGQLLLLIRRLAERQITCLYLARRPADAFQIADRVTVLRDGAVVGTWERTDLDEAAIAAAMASQRYGDFDHVDDDDRPDTGGLLGSLQTFLDQLIRPRS